jgi:hypothetical protein
MIRYHDILTAKEDLETVNKILTSNNWGFKGGIAPKFTKKFWYMSLWDNDFFSGYFTGKIKQILKRDFVVESLYANGQTFGLDSEWHIDSAEENRHTFLYYANPVWDLIWGGETLIRTDDGRIQYIPPEPNSAIFFPSNLYHYGRSPTRDCPYLRTTVAFKLNLLN